HARQAAGRAATQNPEPKIQDSAVAAAAAPSPHTPEQHLLMLCLHFETLGKPLSTVLPHDWIDIRHAAGILLNRFLGEFEHDAWPGRDHLESLLESENERALVANLLFESPAIDDPVKVAQEGLRQLRARA